MTKKRLTYKEAGVNIEAAEHSVKSLKAKVETTMRPEVISSIGGFSGLFALDVDQYREPVLVSGTDGVGTKLKVAFAAGTHHTVGIDLVAMCANDILVVGAEPLFFLDYISLGELKPELVDEIVDGVVEGCRRSGCALLGGETAEMPDFYPSGEYDIAGFIVGVVEKNNAVDGSQITSGDVVLGLSSAGLHSNGFSLARKVLFEKNKFTLDSKPDELDNTLGDELLVPTKIYIPAVLPAAKEGLIKGMAHITGGGIINNLTRVLPDSCDALLHKSWEIPEIFHYIQKTGNIEEEEMFRTFNMGVGFILIVSPENVDTVIKKLEVGGESASLIGEIVSGQGEVKWKK